MFERKQNHLRLMKSSFALLFLFIFILSACTNHKDAMKVRIGYELISPDLPYFVAIENGYFKDEGLSVESYEFKTTNDQAIALLSGNVDMVPNCSMAIALAAEIEQPGQFIVFQANGDIGNKLLVLVDSPIVSVDELSKKQIGVFPGTTLIMYSKLSLKSYFDNNNQPEYIGIAPPSLIEALTTKQVDAILPVEPVASIAINTGVAREILDDPYGKIITPFVGGFSIFNTSFVENKPEIAAAVKRAMDRASQYINENPEKSLVILAKYTGYDSKLLKGMSFGNYWTLELIDKEAVQNMADILYNAGLVTKQIDTSHWYYKN